MAIELSRLVSNLKSEDCVLLFGAGASVPSGAPSVARLIDAIENKFSMQDSGLTLAEISTLVESDVSNRRELISTIRPLFDKLRPSGGLLNVALYEWKGIYTTNYDQLVEEAFRIKKKPFRVTSSNFDFSQPEVPGAQRIYKLHGSIERDVVDGYQARLILSEQDYSLTEDFRAQLYDRMKADMAGSRVIIIGQSLADPHIKELVDRAIKLNAEVNSGRSVAILSYTRDERRAALLEGRGLQVAFGGIDEFFVELAKVGPSVAPVFSSTGDPLDAAPILQGLTQDIRSRYSLEFSNVTSMFNGWPATYGDILAKSTFSRTLASEIVSYLKSNEGQFAVVAGASGVGKTTAARQAAAEMLVSRAFVWEHSTNSPLIADAWIRVADTLAESGQSAVLLIDDASDHIAEVNKLVDHLAASGNSSLELILTAQRASWQPRVKSPYLYRRGKEFLLRRLDMAEIDRLLSLVDNNPSINALMELSFKGFSRSERRRRLVERCETDFFVCLKNIFASEKFDDIILREYASLDVAAREVYRVVATLHGAGVAVHRQMVVRLLNISAQGVASLLGSLADVVAERTIDARLGIFAWTGRHQVISEIIARYKYADQEALFSLLSNVISNIQPTYHLEVRSLRDICNSEYGIRRIGDRARQNELLRMIMSVVPGERVPRHRLIRNLIRVGQFEQAATEIRIFEKDFREDGPVARYKIDLMIARAENSPGILDEDRLAILNEAVDFATSAIQRYADNKYVLFAYAQVGIKWFKKTGDASHFDHALDELRQAEERLADPEISSMIVKVSRAISFVEADDEVDPALAFIEESSR